jgi:hypothetical protein
MNVNRAIRRPIFADNDLLVAAVSQGHPGALGEIRTGRTFITPNQFREFMDVSTSAQRSVRRMFLHTEGIRLFSGPRAGTIARSPIFQQVFQAVVKPHGRGDAALVAFAKTTGYTAVTMDRRLYRFLTHTVPQLQVPIRRVI